MIGSIFLRSLFIVESEIFWSLHYDLSSFVNEIFNSKNLRFDDFYRFREEENLRRVGNFY